MMVSPASTNRNNGQQQMDQHRGAVLSWKPGHGGEAKELISIDKDRLTQFEIPEIALKTVLEDNNEAIACTQSIHHCLEFEMFDMLKEIYTLLAFKPAVGGTSRLQFLYGITGILPFDNKWKSNSNDGKNNERSKGMYNGPPTS